MCLITLEGLELFILTLLLLQFCKLGRIGLSWKDEAFGWLNGLVVSGFNVCDCFALLNGLRLQFDLDLSMSLWCFMYMSLWCFNTGERVVQHWGENLSLVSLFGFMFLRLSQSVITMEKGNSCHRSVDQVREQMEQAQEEGDEIIGINSKSYFRASRRSRRIDPAAGC